MLVGNLTLGVKLPGREVDHSPVGYNNEGATPPLLHIPSRCAGQLSRLYAFSISHFAIHPENPKVKNN